jgi:hypothetical protein
LTDDLGIKLEMSGRTYEANIYYLSRIATKAIDEQTLMGLFRTTMQLGDIDLVLERLNYLLQLDVINRSLLILLSARLNVEICEFESATDLLKEVSRCKFPSDMSVDFHLATLDVLISNNSFLEAYQLTKSLGEESTVFLRRRIEIEILMGQPKSAFESLKKYVGLLNLEFERVGSSTRYITASGMLFHLANQIWLDQGFDNYGDLLPLNKSMEIIRSHSNKHSNASPPFNQNLSLDMDISNFSWMSRRNSYISFEQSKKIMMGFINSLPRGPIEVTWVPKLDWEQVHQWDGIHDYFFCEESGYVSTSNFALSGNSPIAKKWVQCMRSFQYTKVSEPIDLHIGGGLLTRIIATYFVENSNDVIPLVYPRGVLRRHRTLSPKYISGLSS